MSENVVLSNLDIGEELSVQVDFDYYPPEPMTWDYPGCGPDISINNVQWESEDVNKENIELTEKEFDKFEDEIIERINDYHDYQS